MRLFFLLQPPLHRTFPFFVEALNLFLFSYIPIVQNRIAESLTTRLMMYMYFCKLMKYNPYIEESVVVSCIVIVVISGVTCITMFPLEFINCTFKHEAFVDIDIPFEPNSGLIYNPSATNPNPRSKICLSRTSLWIGLWSISTHTLYMCSILHTRLYVAS